MTLQPYVVYKRGGLPDPPGARYFVFNYTHDPAATAAARSYATQLVSEHKAIGDELRTSLEGGPEGATLQNYEVMRVDDQEDPPGSRYLVVDYAHSYPARLAVRIYAIKVSADHPGLTARLDQELADTMEQAAEYIKSQNPKKRKRRK